MKAYFVFDAETGYILSGFDCVEDKHEDGFNTFTRPFKYPEFHPKDEKCRLDKIYKDSLIEGLKSLKYSNLKVGVVDSSFAVKQVFVKNPHYFDSRGATNGWWKITDFQNITIM